MNNEYLTNLSDNELNALLIDKKHCFYKTINLCKQLGVNKNDILNNSLIKEYQKQLSKIENEIKKRKIK